MEMIAPTADADGELLAQMFDYDILSGEIFRRVYGIGYQKYLDAYNKSKRLPAPARDYCIKFLAQKQPHTIDAIAHSLPG